MIEIGEVSEDEIRLLVQNVIHQIDFTFETDKDRTVQAIDLSGLCEDVIARHIQHELKLVPHTDDYQNRFVDLFRRVRTGALTPIFNHSLIEPDSTMQMIERGEQKVYGGRVFKGEFVGKRYTISLRRVYPEDGVEDASKLFSNQLTAGDYLADPQYAEIKIVRPRY